QRGLVVIAGLKPSGPAIHHAAQTCPDTAATDGCGAVLALFSNVAHTLSTNSLVVGDRAQDLSERPLVHASRLNRHGTVGAPLESGAQFFDATRRAIPPVAHR